MSPAVTNVRLAPNNPVFDLPAIVAIEEGLFYDKGLDVKFVADHRARDLDAAETPRLMRLKENLFETDEADSYNVCEWASIDRLERGSRGGNIGALRAAVAAQAILSFDEALQTPRDMSHVPVAVQEFTGSHFTVLWMLESAVGSDHVVVERSGLPYARYVGLKAGTYRAIAVMEPFISLALKEGAHIVASTFYRGGEVVGANLSADDRTAYYEAENAAVDLINADFYKYAHHVTVQARGGLEPAELLRAFVRYKHVDYYNPTLFECTYGWMKQHGFTEGESEHAIVVGAKDL